MYFLMVTLATLAAIAWAAVGTLEMQVEARAILAAAAADLTLVTLVVARKTRYH